MDRSEGLACPASSATPRNRHQPNLAIASTLDSFPKPHSPGQRKFCHRRPRTAAKPGSALAQIHNLGFSSITYSGSRPVTTFRSLEVSIFFVFFPFPFVRRRRPSPTSSSPDLHRANPGLPFSDARLHLPKARSYRGKGRRNPLFNLAADRLHTRSSPLSSRPRKQWANQLPLGNTFP